MSFLISRLESQFDAKGLGARLGLLLPHSLFFLRYYEGHLLLNVRGQFCVRYCSTLTCHL